MKHEQRGVPYGSRDVRHVPEPQDALLWPFSTGQARTIGIEPLLAFQVTEIHNTWVEGVETLGSTVVHGELHLDRPVVITKTVEGHPLVTLTLRRIEEGKAFIQVTAAPSMKAAARQ